MVEFIVVVDKMIKAEVVFDNYKILVGDHVISLFDGIVVFGIKEPFATIEEAVKWCLENSDEQ